MRSSPPRLARFVVLACLAVGVLLRVESTTGRVLCYDEVYSLWVSAQPPEVILRESATTDPHPPGYYLLLAGWRRLVGPSAEAARSLALVAWLASLLLVWRVASSWFGWPVASWAVCLLSLNAFQVVASTEARMYMLLQLFAVGSTWLLWRAATTPTARNWAAYGFCAAAMAYLSYYSALLLAAQAVWAIQGLPRELRGRLGIACLSGVAAYSPWLPFLWGSVTANPVPWRPPLGALDLAALLATQVYGGHWMGSAGYYGGKVLSTYETALGLLPVVLLIPGFRILSKVNPKAAGLVGWSWAAPLGIAAGLSLALGKTVTYAYHLTYIQPLAAIMAGAAAAGVWDAAAPFGRRVGPLVSSALLLAYAAHGADAAWRDVSYQPFRYDLAARYLRTLYQQGDLVVYFGQGLRRVMHVYFDPPGPEEQVAFGLRAWVHLEAAEVEARRELKKLFSGPHRRIWVVAGPPQPAWVAEITLNVAKHARLVPGPVARFGAVIVAVFVRPRERP